MTFFYKHIVPTGLKNATMNEEHGQNVLFMRNNIFHKVI